MLVLALKTREGNPLQGKGELTGLSADATVSDARSMSFIAKSAPCPTRLWKRSVG